MGKHSILLTIPLDLYTEIKAIAAAEHRSVTGQVLYILSTWLLERKAREVKA